MGVSITEVLEALGDYSIDFDWAQSLDDLTEKYTHILVSWDEERIWAGPLLRKARGRGGITPGGRSLEWHLGLDKTGPMIEDRWYPSGISKLSNGDFTLFGADLSDPLYWKKAGADTKWIVDPGVAGLVFHPDHDDVLAADVDTIEATAGQSFTLRITARRAFGSGAGRLRGRLIFVGRYTNPDLLAGKTWADVSEFTGDVAIGADIRLGPTTRKQIITNGDFEVFGALSGWDALVQPTASATGVSSPVYSGSQAVKLTYPTDNAYFGRLGLWLDQHDPSPVTPGERYRFEVVAYIGGVVTGDIATRIRYVPGSVAGEQAEAWRHAAPPAGEVEFSPAGGVPLWIPLTHDFEIPEGATALYTGVAMDLDDGRSASSDPQPPTPYWVLDHVSVTRIAGNTCRARMVDGPFAIIPEQTYRIEIPVAADASLTEGSVKILATVAGDGRATPLTFESSPIDFKALERSTLTLDLTAPSGYDSLASVDLVGMDITGGGFTAIGRPKMVLQNVEHRIVDLVMGSANFSDTDFTMTAVAPDGTDHLEVQLVAEDAGGGYQVVHIDVVLDGGPTSAADVVRSLLAAGITEGTFHDAGNIRWDLHAKNQTSHELLAHVSKAGFVEPAREWRLNPDGTLDWGLPEELFVDHTDIILTPDDLVLLDQPQGSEDVETQVTDVKLIGATRERADGTHVQVTAQASTGATVYGWDGEPTVRTEIVEDSRVDHAAFADAYVTDLATTRKGKASQRFRLSDWRTIGKFNVGDWIYVYAPKAGLVDMTNPMTLGGATVYPYRTRVLSRTWHPAKGDFRVELRKLDGTIVPLSDRYFVRWEKETTAEVELGDFRAEFIESPEGPQTGNQYKQFRMSAAR